MSREVPFVWSYQDHVRPLYLEEPVDYFFYRPLAYGVIRATYFLPLTPNHFSVLGLLLAIFASFCLSQGSASSFFLAGCGILLFGVMDCCDGMIARLKKNGSPLGEQIDMFVDALASIFYFCGLLLAYDETRDGHLYFILLLLFLPTLLLHTSLYNYHKKQYLFSSRGHVLFDEKQREQLKRQSRDYKKKGGHYFERLLIFLYLHFNKAQSSCFNSSKSHPEKYAQVQRRMLPLWSLIAGSTHLTLLALCLMFNRPALAISTIVIFGNLWLLAVWLIQKMVLKATYEV